MMIRRGWSPPILASGQTMRSGVADHECWNIVQGIQGQPMLVREVAQKHEATTAKHDLDYEKIQAHTVVLRDKYTISQSLGTVTVFIEPLFLAERVGEL